MIPSISNIKKAIYCLNKRIDLLEGGHYQDTMVQLSTKVKALESLVSDELNPTAAIDKFNEIISFLNLIENTETLKDFLDSIHDDISTINLELSKINSELYSQANHEYVDLGLPSGTLWATMNVGASSITDYGNYYKYGLGASQYDNAQPDYSGTENPLAASADTAVQVWGEQWHMPTRAQMQELTTNTTYEWTTINGVNGGKFTATNGNYVFFPAAGLWGFGSQSNVGFEGHYCGSSPNGSIDACNLYFFDDGRVVYDISRRGGYSVRPVLDSLPYNFVKRNEVGVTVASLDNNGKVPASLLPESNEFIAIYNETSFADVKTKFLEGKDIYVKYQDCKLGLTKVENIDSNNASFRFSRSLGKSGAVIKLISTGWSVIGSDLTLVQADWNLVDDTQVDFIKNKPTIPNTQIQSDWNQTNTESKDYIKNKPTIVSDVAYDTTNKKITKTINGTTSDVVTSEKVVEDGGGINLVEGYYYDKKFYEDVAHTTEITGADGRIYIDKTTNREYRFDGTKYRLLKSEVDGNFVSESTFTYRPTAGALDVESGAVSEGGALVECIKGNSIAWNQIYIGYRANNFNGVTITLENGISYANGTSVSAPQDVIIRTAHSYQVNHKYLYVFNTYSEYFASWINGGTSVNYNSFKTIFLKTASNFPSISLRVKPDSEINNATFNIQLFDLTLIYGTGNEPTTPEQFEADYFKWFGKPLGYEAYDAGSILTSKLSGFKTVGFNQWDGEYTQGYIINASGETMANTWYSVSSYIKVVPNQTYHLSEAQGSTSAMALYDKDKNLVSVIMNPTIRNNNYLVTIPNDVIYIRTSINNSTTSSFCVNLSHSGDRNGDYEPYWKHTVSLPVTQIKGKLNGEGESVIIFPDGMKSAGSVYDEIKVENGVVKAIKRVGKIDDLGNVHWITLGTSDALFFETVESTHKQSTRNALNARYCTYGNVTTATTDDKIIGFNAGNAIRIKDLSYTESEQFKNSLAGQTLYFELAEPQVYILDDFELPIDYPVDDYGTEEILSNSANSLAPTLDIRYGINAKDTIRNLPYKYVSAVESQNFTEVQKERARVNIGAISEEELESKNFAKVWRGTLAEYDLILNPSDNTIYIILSS